MRKILIVGNWKMNLNTHQSSLLLSRLEKRIKKSNYIEVVLAPSMLVLQPLSTEVNRRKFRLAAQNAYHKDEGAYTGEVSFSMLRELVHYALVGHSERRIYFGEDLDEVRDKVEAAVRNGIVPILCVGENRQEHGAGETRQVLHDQIETALSNLTSEDIDKVVIAYEPVWAISTFDSEIAKPFEVERAIKFIRAQVRELYGTKAAKEVRVLFGGNVDEQNVRSYLEIDGCDGILAGGSSLNYIKFSALTEAARKYQREQAAK